MRKQPKQTRGGLPKGRQGASPALTAPGRAQADDGQPSKPASQPRGEEIPQGSRMSAHPVFVLDIDGDPLTPTTPAKAKKLLKGGVATPVWSKFGTFGIRMLVGTRRQTPRAALGVDHGTKFEGYSVVVDAENSLNVKLDLPDKKAILKK